MSKVKEHLQQILDCSDCYGQGVIYWGNGEDYDFEYCDCNPNRFIIEDGQVVG